MSPATTYPFIKKPSGSGITLSLNTFIGMRQFEIDWYLFDQYKTMDYSCRHINFRIFYYRINQMQKCIVC